MNDVALFRNRIDAGRQLARKLEGYLALSPQVLGLVRGGVPVAAATAHWLHVPLDVWVVRIQPFHLACGDVNRGIWRHRFDGLFHQVL